MLSESNDMKLLELLAEISANVAKMTEAMEGLKEVVNFKKVDEQPKATKTTAKS